MIESNEIIENEKLLKENKQDTHFILLMLSGLLLGLVIMFGFIFSLILFGANL